MNGLTHIPFEQINRAQMESAFRGLFCRSSENFKVKSSQFDKNAGHSATRTYFCADFSAAFV